MAKSKKASVSKAAAMVRAAGGKTVTKRKGPIMIAGSKVGKVGEMANAKKFSKTAIERALDEKHAMFGVGAAGLVGYLNGSGSMPEIPSFGGLPQEAILGAAMWLGGKYAKSQYLTHGATGLLAVAANKMAEEAAKSSAGDLDVDYDDY